MTDMIQDGLEFLEVQRKAHMARSVTYTRGAYSVVVQATVGATPVDIDDGDGMAIRRQHRDYLLASADLVLNAVTVTPAAGDKITDTLADGDHVFEVVPLGAEKCWRASDGDGVTIRIHTKEVTLP